MPYIDKDALIKAVENLHDCYNGFSDTYDKACFIGLIEEQPTADVVERKRGKWIRKSPTAWMWTCSCCKKDDAYAYSAGESCEPDVLQDLFCPNCGAAMRKETEDVGKI